MVVRLEFLTQNPEERELAIRYWATDKEGAFLERVADLVPFREVIQSGQIAKETLIKATRPGFFVHEAATPKFASS